MRSRICLPLVGVRNRQGLHASQVLSLPLTHPGPRGRSYAQPTDVRFQARRTRYLPTALTPSSRNSTLDLKDEKSHNRGKLPSTVRLFSTSPEPIPQDFPLVSFSRTSGFILGGDSPFAAVFPEVITTAEEEALMAELDPLFRRKRYERGHWDSVIEDYKETERLDGTWSSRCQGIVDSIRGSIASSEEAATGTWLPIHAIDLSPNGFIRPHVDSVKFSGGIVAGLSLLSSAVMQLSRPLDNDFADLLLPPRSLYILRGPARYEWAHAILPNDGSPIKWTGREFKRGRRVSLIFRDKLIGPAPEPHPSTIRIQPGTST